MGEVNCYLIDTGRSFILVDTGSANSRGRLEEALADGGCEPGDLKLIVITHGDFDHIGNALYLSDKYGAPIAMHRHDVGMAEHGDMFWNRESGNPVIKMLAPLLFRFGRSQRFVPDLLLDDGTLLAAYGLDAQVISLLGHSQGSIGVLTAEGDLLSGDLLENLEGPVLGSIMDDEEAARASVERLQAMEVGMVYPGHGQPFPMAAYQQGTQE
jgi:glyoxylase-like metal-dependent hydrolase (beta-lactamase superfamily II)